MTKHTAGPWKIVKPENPDVRQIEDRLIYALSGENALHIAEVYQYQNDKNRESNGTAIANAQLIAAAPDLLEACEKLKYRVDELYSLIKMEIKSPGFLKEKLIPEGLEKIIKEEGSKITETIAKAKGE